MTLSIIIPIYNTEAYIDECIESIFNQGLECTDFEILLIDDGSTDSSLSIAKKWGEIHSNIKVFHQENQGQAIARNSGLDHAQGRFVMFVDSDDFLLPNKLDRLLQIIERERLDALIFNLCVQQQDSTTIISRIPFTEFNHIYSGEEVALKFFVFGSMCKGIFDRSVFANNNLRFRSGFAHEDSELCFRLYPLLKKIVFVDEEVYFYRYNIHSTDRSQEKKKLRRNIESDAILVSKVLEKINCSSYSNDIKARYRNIANSIMTAFFLRIRAEKIWNIGEFEQKIEWLRSINVYPIRGKTNSWKSYIFSKLLNIKPLLKLFLYK